MSLVRTSVLVLAILAPATAQAQLSQPTSISLDRGSTLPIAAQATRVHLLGSVDLYNVAIYANVPLIETAQLASRDTPKAIRILVLYEPDLRRRMTRDWRQELIPAVEPEGVELLRGAFAPIVRGDVVLVEYSPAKGTSVRVNKGMAVSGASHDLMLGFLDHFLGQRPLSEALKAALLGR